MNDFIFYFIIGWEHIIDIRALDHLLFIAVLSAIYLFRDWKQVLILVTAFTLGHAITLFLSAKDFVKVDERWVEFLIPCTIMITAVSNIFQKQFTNRSIRVNYFLALFFGLIHGLAYASNLKMMLAGDQNFVISWLGFSVGLELGQLLVVLLILSLGFLVVQVVKFNRRIWVWVVSIVVAVFAIKMGIERARFFEPRRQGGHRETQRLSVKLCVPCVSVVQKHVELKD